MTTTPPQGAQSADPEPMSTHHTQGQTAAPSITDKQISEICSALHLKWYVPDDSDRYAWTTINTDQLQRIVRAAITKATGSTS